MSSDLSYDFTLTAIVTNVSMPTGPKHGHQRFGQRDLNIATYGMVDLDISDKSTRTTPGDEVTITFQFQNNGNDEDKIRASIVNAADLEAAGFTFPAALLWLKTRRRRCIERS